MLAVMHASVSQKKYSLFNNRNIKELSTPRKVFGERFKPLRNKIMKKLRLKNFFKYTLAVVCVCCAMIAGVFSLQKTNVLAEETTITTDIYVSGLDLMDDGCNYSHNSCASVVITASISGDALTKFNTGDFDIQIKHEIGETFLYAHYSTPVGELASRKRYYVLSIYPGESEEDKSSSIDTLYNNHPSRRFTKGTPGFNTSDYYIQAGETFIFDIPVVYHPSFGTTEELLSKTTEYTWFIDLWEVMEEEYIEEVEAGMIAGYWTVVSTKSTYGYNKIYSSSNDITTSINELARNQLSSLASDSTADVDWLFNYAGLDGYTADKEVTVNLNYKIVDYDDINERIPYIVDISTPYIIPARIMFNEQEVLNYVNKMSGKPNVSDYNCVFFENFDEFDKSYELGARIILQATSIDYAYNDTYGVGEINVSYSPFEYKDFSLYITNGDPANRLIVNYYKSEVKPYEDLLTLTFYFEDIENNLKNKVNWHIDLEQSEFKILNVPEGVTCTVDDYALTVAFKESEQDKLVNLLVYVVADIEEDVEYTYNYEYVTLDDNLNETTKTSPTYKAMRSDLIALSKKTFLNWHGTTVNEAISPAILDGEIYCEVAGISRFFDTENKTCLIKVLYDYKTVLRLNSNLSDTPVYVLPNNINLKHDYDDLKLEEVLVEGWRIKDVSSKNKTDLDIEFSEASPKDILITINCDINKKKVIDVDVTLSGTWYLEINYLKQYIDSPFAVHTTVNKEVNVASYDNIKNITTAQVAELLGVSNFYLFPIKDSNGRYMTNGYVIPEKVEYVDESKYKITLEYAYTTIRYTQSDGTQKEKLIPLTCYDDWCNNINANWSILWLNRGKEATWFYRTDEVPRDKLYGFFSSLVFEERVSDLNSWFADLSYNGGVVVNSCESVSGSALYRFYYSELGTIWHIQGLLGMFFEEYTDVVFGKDTNKMLYTYFFYLDCSTTDRFMTHTGADNGDDTGSAIDNTKEDIFEQLKSLASEGFWQTPFGKFLMWTAIILGGLLVLGIAIKILKG